MQVEAGPLQPTTTPPAAEMLCVIPSTLTFGGPVVAEARSRSGAV